MTSSQSGKCDDVLDEYRLLSSAKGLHFYTNVLTIILNALFSVPGIFFNVLIIVSYLINKRLRTPCTMLFVASATFDLMVNSIVQPMYIMKKAREIIGSDGCLIATALKFATYTCCGCSLAIAVVLSIERFITLAYPYHYQNIVNQFRLNLSVSLMWFMIFLSVFSHYFRPSIIHFYIAAAYLIACIIMIVFIWIWIQRLILYHQRQIMAQQNIQIAARKHQKRVSNTKSSCILITVLLLSYLPSTITNLYTLPKGSDFNMYYLLYPWILSVLYWKSTITPLFVFWRKKVFIDTAKSICYKLIRR